MNAPEPYLVWKDPDAPPTPDAPQVIGRAAVNKWIRNGALGALLLIALPPLPTLIAPLWLLAVTAGYAAAVLIAVVMLLPLRRLAHWPPVRISVARHKRLAELALALSALHTLLFLAADSLTVEYLMPSQPRYMMAGNAGLVLLALLVVTSLERVRVAAFGPRVRFRTLHVTGSVVLVVLVCAHMVGSAIYVGSPLKAALCALICAALVAATLKRPKDRLQECEPADMLR